MMLSVQQVEQLLSQEVGKYRALTLEVRTACEEVAKELGASAVRTIYGRADKQKNDGLSLNDLKSPEKIALALRKLKSEKVTDVTDVSGLTVVVHYSDQVERFTERLAFLLKEKRIVIASNKVKKDGGYYATHVVFKSNHTNHRKLHCEVQVKTMLHDAWSAKTHDLTYKPQGRHDDRLNRMMNLFADALQSIEVQSETLRDLIEERWASEVGWRHALREDMKSWIPVWMDASLKSEDSIDLRQLIESNREKLGECDDDDDLVEEIAERLDKLCDLSLKEGYLLETFFSVVREQKKEQLRARERTRGWLNAVLEEHKSSPLSGSDIWTVPLVFYLCGDLQAAISSGERLIDADILRGEGLQVLKLNLANHLIEHAYFSLPADKEEQIKLRGDIVTLLSEAPDLKEKDPSAFYDAEGMLEVSFSDDTETLRKSIDLIYKGNVDVPDKDKDTANAYFELNIRLAWRRLLDAETRKSLESLVKKKITSE